MSEKFFSEEGKKTSKNRYAKKILVEQKEF